MKTVFRPTIEEIHQWVGEPFELEIGTMTQDGYTGDSVYYHHEVGKHLLIMNVNYYIDQIELRIEITSLYGYKAKKKAVLLEAIRDTLEWTESKVTISDNRYKDTKGYYMKSARNENEMKTLVELAHMVIKKLGS